MLEIIGFQHLVFLMRYWIRLSKRINSLHHQRNDDTSFSKPHENGVRKVEVAKEKVISMVKYHMKCTLTREHR